MPETQADNLSEIKTTGAKKRHSFWLYAVLCYVALKGIVDLSMGWSFMHQDESLGLIIWNFALGLSLLVPSLWLFLSRFSILPRQIKVWLVLSIILILRGTYGTALTIWFSVSLPVPLELLPKSLFMSVLPIIVGIYIFKLKKNGSFKAT